MINLYASFQDGHIIVQFKSQDREALKEMEESVTDLGGGEIIVIEEHEDFFKIRIDKKEKEVAERILSLAGHGKRRIKHVSCEVDKDLYEYLELG
nr:hypothetical protein [Candidatus Njordarchaeota archaeon]